jgi:thiamine biosynthesis lipoprotein
MLRNGACATSGDYFGVYPDRWPIVSPSAGPPRRGALMAAHTVTVLARSCMLADALTKVVALDGAAAEPLMARFGARTSTLH